MAFLRSHFLWFLSLLALSAPPLAAQDFATTADRILEQVEATESTLDPSSRRELDVSSYDVHALYGKLSTVADTEGRARKLTNTVATHNGGSHSQVFYLDEKGSLLAMIESFLDLAPDGSRSVSDETRLFENDTMIGSISENGQFPAGQEIRRRQMERYLIPIGETDASGDEEFRFRRDQALRIRGLVAGLSGRTDQLPASLLLDSLSPDGRYLVSWAWVNENEGTAEFTLFDLDTVQPVAPLPGGLGPGMNHVYHSFYWGESSEVFVFVIDGKWSTIHAPIYQVEDGKATEIGDVFEIATRYAWDQLKATGHPYAREGEGIHGNVQIIQLLPDGRVHLVLNTSSNQDGPEFNVRSEMTLKFQPGDDTLTGGFAVLDWEEPVGKPATFSNAMPPADSTPTKKSGITISAKKFGPITAETPFDLRAIRDLFPDFTVAADTATFEEGGDQPVVVVRSGDEQLLTIAPVVDEAKLGHVYTFSPAVSTQLGFAPGDTFGSIFSKIPDDAFLEGLTGDAVTSAAGIENITFRFFPNDPASFTGNDLPPYDELKTWKLHAIEWRPIR